MVVLYIYIYEYVSEFRIQLYCDKCARSFHFSPICAGDEGTMLPIQLYNWSEGPCCASNLNTPLALTECPRLCSQLGSQSFLLDGFPQPAQLCRGVGAAPPRKQGPAVQPMCYSRFLVAADITAFASAAEGGEHQMRLERALLFAHLRPLLSQGCV